MNNVSLVPLSLQWAAQFEEGLQSLTTDWFLAQEDIARTITEFFVFNIANDFSVNALQTLIKNVTGPLLTSLQQHAANTNVTSSGTPQQNVTFEVEQLTILLQDLIPLILFIDILAIAVELISI
mgnify:CR=1 FL=1